MNGNDRKSWQWSWCSHRRHRHHAVFSEIFAGGRGASITRFALATQLCPAAGSARTRSIWIVRILADGDIHGAGDAGQVHVDLYLRPMLRLGALDTIPFQRRKRFRRVGLELDHVPGFRRFEQGDGIERAAEVAAQRRDLPLAPRFRVGVENRRPRPPQVADQPVLLPLPGVEQPQHAAGQNARRVTQRKSYQRARSHSLPMIEAPRWSRKPSSASAT